MHAACCRQLLDTWKVRGRVTKIEGHRQVGFNAFAAEVGR